MNPSVNGGIEAPPTAGRGRRRRPPRRQRELAAAIQQARQAGHPINPQQQPPTLPLPINKPVLPRPVPTPSGRPENAKAFGEAISNAHKPQTPARGRGQGVGQNEIPGYGHQLTRRVNQGAITQQQAQKVAQERALLEKEFGPEWRVKVFGDRGYQQRARTQYAQNPNDPQVKALLENLKRLRKRAVEKARANNPVGEAEAAEE